MNHTDLLHNMLPKIDPRSSEQIQREVEDEFDFHLAALEAELIQSGTSLAEARNAARVRFGNADKYRYQCTRIALEERIMLQRINAVLMVIVLLAVIGVSVQMYLTQRHNSLALQAIVDDIADMKVEALADTGESAESAGVVFIDGNVPRPGVYQIPKGGILNLNHLLSAVGGFENIPVHISVMREQGDNQECVFEKTVTELSDLWKLNVSLQDGDYVSVERLPSSPRDGSDDVEGQTETSWRDRITAQHIPRGFTASELGNEFAQLDPEEVFQILSDNWNDIPNRNVKQQLIEGWYYRNKKELDREAHLLDVLHLGMTDDDSEVQRWALYCLRILVVRDFSFELTAYEPWYEANRDRPCLDVVADELRRIVGELREAEGFELKLLSELIDENTGIRLYHPELNTVLKEEGLFDILAEFINSDDKDRNAATARLIPNLDLDEEFLRQVAVPAAQSHEELGIRHASITALGNPENKWAVDILLAILLDEFEKLPHSSRSEKSTVEIIINQAAKALGEIGDPKVIPTMIGLLDTDVKDAELAFRGVAKGLGKFTGVEYDESHDGEWWRYWWMKNKDRFGPEVAALPIPEFETTPVTSAQLQDESKNEADTSPSREGTDINVAFLSADDLATAIVQRKDPELRAASLEWLQEMLSTESPIWQQKSGLAILEKSLSAKFDRQPFRPLVIELMKSDEVDIRSIALRCFPALDATTDDLDLVIPLADDEERSVRALVGRALIGIDQGKNPDVVIPVLIKLLNDSDGNVIYYTIRSMWGQYSSPEFDELLIRLSRDKSLSNLSRGNKFHHDVIYFSLSQMQSKSVPVCERLVEELAHPDHNNKGRAAWGLTYGVVEEAKALVEDGLLAALPEETHDYTREQEFRALRNVVTEKSRPYLMSVIESEMETERFKHEARAVLEYLDRQ